nr:M23 family metallopeptidase [Gracilibacillus halotolerans]
MPIICILFFSFTTIAYAEENVDKEEQIKINQFKQIEALTHVPWYYLAAINQFESNIHDDKDEDKSIHIQLPKELWYGTFLHTPVSPKVLEIFNGIGKDGDGDGIADPNSELDTLYTIASYISSNGYTEQDIHTAIWNIYQHEQSLLTIKSIAKLFKTYQRLHLDTNSFPIPKQYNYSYKNTWGDARGFGGRRIHEGTDIFADYGTPVRSTTYGVVELKGWNKYGGWRIGIRDKYNRYHYYAHLNGFADDLEVGDVVEPGQVVGSVGSTGYGPPGTSGKFPPHLHYGIYKFDGSKEWSFDPYPHLRKWERESD